MAPSTPPVDNTPTPQSFGVPIYSDSSDSENEVIDDANAPINPPYGWIGTPKMERWLGYAHQAATQGSLIDPLP